MIFCFFVKIAILSPSFDVLDHHIFFRGIRQSSYNSRALILFRLSLQSVQDTIPYYYLFFSWWHIIRLWICRWWSFLMEIMVVISVLSIFWYLFQLFAESMFFWVFRFLCFLFFWLRIRLQTICYVPFCKLFRTNLAGYFPKYVTHVSVLIQLLLPHFNFL